MDGTFLLHKLSLIAGAACLFLSMADVFMTVLYARAGAGPLSRRLAKVCWNATRWVCHRLPKYKDSILAYFGPAFLVLLMVTWMGLLLLGFTLLAWPALGTGIRATSDTTPTDFLTAFYYAGGSLTTVGSNDLVPRASFYKFLTVIDSIIGMSILTLTLSYIIQVYTALHSRNALTLAVHHASGGSGDAAQLLAALGPNDDFTQGTNLLTNLAGEVTATYESHHFYPVLIYFRFREPHYALARSALVILETLALIDTVLDEDRHSWLSRSAAVIQLREASMHVLTELAQLYLPQGVPPTGHQPPHVLDLWRQRYHAALTHLHDAGISTTHHPDHNANRYIDLRKQWDALIMAFAKTMEHNTNDIDPTGSTPSETAHHRELPNPPLSATG